MPVNVTHYKGISAVPYKWTGVHYYAFTIACMLELDPETRVKFEKECPDRHITDIPRLAHIKLMAAALAPVSLTFRYSWKFEGEEGEVIQISPGDVLEVTR